MLVSGLMHILNNGLLFVARATRARMTFLARYPPTKTSPIFDVFSSMKWREIISSVGTVWLSKPSLHDTVPYEILTL